MSLLRLISWPYLRKHLLRSLLTVAGIVLGVGVFVAIHTANQSVLAALNDTIVRIAGKTQLQVTAGEPGFDEDILEKLQKIPEVRTATPLIEVVVATDFGNLLILGVDLVGDHNLRSYELEDADDAIDDPLVFLALPDSLVITQTFAKKNRLRVNSTIPMKTMLGDRVLTVRGIMKPGGLASAFGGDLAIMDIYAVQKFLGRGHKFDRIDLVLNDKVSLDQAATAIRAALGPGFDVQPPSSRGEQFEQTSRLYSISSNITSVFALVIGMFIIYTTFSVAVTQRRIEIGILRAMGALGSQVCNLFLAESAITGLVGSALGIAGGVALARGMSRYIGSVLSAIYGVAQNVDGVSLSPSFLVGSLFMGVLTSIVAAVVPARAAAGVAPVEAWQKGRYQVGGHTGRARAWLAAAASVLSVCAVVLGGGTVVNLGGFVLAVGAAILLAPNLAIILAKTLRPALAWIRPVEGVLAADSLIQSPRRTAGAVSGLMLSLSLTIALGGLASASYSSISDWVRIAMNPDLFVTTAPTITSRDFAFADSLGGGLRSIGGVAEVQAVRSVRVSIKGRPVMLVAVDIASLEKRSRPPAIRGDAGSMYGQAAQGKGVLISESFARLHGAQLNDVLEIPTPQGLLRLAVAGIVRDLSDQQGSILISREIYKREWHDDTVTFFRIYLQPGVDEAAVRQRILDSYGRGQRLFVLTNRDVRAFITGITDQWFGLTYVQIAVAVLVAVLGIVNALTASITDRRRELGVLQAVGALRRQIRHTIWIEACSIGIIGTILGLALGAVTLFYAVGIARRDLLGFDIGYEYPIRLVSFLIPLMGLAVWAAAIGPAVSAGRGSLVAAIEYE